MPFALLNQSREAQTVPGRGLVVTAERRARRRLPTELKDRHEEEMREERDQGTTELAAGEATTSFGRIKTGSSGKAQCSWCEVRESELSFEVFP